jgi:hypothetical protein
MQSTRKWARENNQPASPIDKFDMQGILMDRGLGGIHNVLEDYRLVDLADGVVNMPTGDDRRLVTTAIEHAMTHGNSDVRLSQFHAYVRDNHLDQIYFPPMLRGRANADRIAKDLHRDTTYDYGRSIGWSSR